MIMFVQQNKDVMQELRKLENNFNGLEYRHILCRKNEVADELAKLESSQAIVPRGSLCRNPMSQGSRRRWLKPA
jgi:butyrate kinase